MKCPSGGRRPPFIVIALLLFAASVSADPYAKRVVAFHGFPQRDNGRPVPPGDPQSVLGPPQPGPGQPGKVPRLGSGGEIVIDMGAGDEIIDERGTDFKIWEHGAPENYWVLGAQQLGGPWEFIGYGKGSREFDLNGARLPWVRYLLLADLECVDEGEGSEAADFDAVQALHQPRRGETLAPTAGPAGRLLVGRWRYDGRFNSKPTSLIRMLANYDRLVNPPVPTSFIYVDSEDPEDFFSCGILFMTGHRDFVLDPPQRAALREYIERGGFLLADACCGNPTFAQSFRREIQRTFPEMRLQRLPPGHEIYQALSPVDARLFPLEAMVRDERAVIVFSPSGLVCAWEEMRCPRNHPTPPPADALRLGANLVVYALTN